MRFRFATFLCFLLLVTFISLPSYTQAFFDRPLFLGTSGEDVSLLQRILKDKGFYTYPEITGFFGPVTQLSLQVFQKTYNIVSSGTPETTGYGRVGPATRVVLNNLLPATENGFSLSASLLSSAIYRLQELLTQAGYLSTSPSGVLDTSTLSAISKWQASQSKEGETTRSSNGRGGSGGGGGSSTDTTAPVRSNSSPSGTLSLGTTNTTLVLDTDETATCKYSISSGQAFSSMTTFDTTGTTSHSSSITGLSNGGSYVYYIKCEDSSANTNSDDFTISFTVAADATSPTVSITAPTNNEVVSGDSVSISATASDDIGVAGVQFKLNTNTNIGAEDTTSSYGVTWDATAVADGSHTLIAVARDGSGNYATSSVITVTVDNTGPVISSIASGTPGETSATITWTTNELADSRIDYGTTDSYGTASTSATLATSHSITLTGLTNNTTYHFRVQSTDAEGNVATSSDQTFTTDASVSLTSAHSRIVFYGDGIGSDGSAPGEANFPTMTLVRLDGRLRGAVGWMQHKSGGEMQTIYARRDYTINQKPDVVVIGSMGHNPEVEGSLFGLNPSVDSTLIDRWKRNVQAIVDGLPDARIFVSTTIASTGSEPYREEVWTLQRAFVESLNDNVVLWDPSDLFNASTMTFDGIHPNQIGGNALAEDLVALMDPYLEDVSRDVILAETSASGDFGANLDTDHALTGTTGTKSGTVAPTGNYATGKRITNNLTNGTSVSVTVSKDSSPGSYENQIAVVSGTPASSATIVQDDTGNITLTNSAPGTYYEMIMELKIDDGSGGVPTGFRTWNSALGNFGTLSTSAVQANTTADKTSSVDYVIRVPARPTFGSSGPMVANPTVTTRWSAVSTNGRITISRPILRQVELTAYAAPYYIGSDSIFSANYLIRITGTATVGSTLRCEPGAWSGGALVFSPQWYQNGIEISGATNWTYVVQAGDSGTTLTCRPRPSNSFGSDTTTATAGTAIP